MASRSALIVANGQYQSAKLRQLRAPAVDADALARVFANPEVGDFEVELVRDQPEYVLRRRIARFFADRRRDDLLLLHISCHGLKDDDGHLYFATPDTEIDALDSTAVPEDFVRLQMSKSRSGCIVLLLDCCYSGAFSRGMAARAGTGVDLKERFAARGRAVITASNAMEYSFEGDDISGQGEPSVFTRAVVKGLETGEADRDRDGWIGFDELYDYVYDEVRGTSPQHPLKWVDVEGDLRIAKSVHRPPAPVAELPPDLRTAIDSPERHTRLGAVHVLANLVAGPDSALARAAHEALERLAQDDSRLVSEPASRTLAGLGPPADVTAGTREVVSGKSPGQPSVVPAKGPPAVAPVWSRKPRLVGESRVGQRLSLDRSPSRGDVVSFSYEWEREQRPSSRSHIIPDACSDHYEPVHDDVGCRLRAKVTARGRSGEAVGETEWSAPVAAQAESLPIAQSSAMRRVRTVDAVAVAGAVIVIGSLIPSNQYSELTRFGYRGVVALISVAVIGLIGLALLRKRRTPLLIGTCLAFALFGVTFPMSWSHQESGNLPTFPAFWVGAIGAAIASLSALAAAWAAYDEPLEADGAPPQQARSIRAGTIIAISGAAIAIGSLFVLAEWSDRSAPGTTWQNWPHHRYPAVIILLSGLVIVLSIAAVRLRRNRLLVAATAFACLLLGEAVPLHFTDPNGWTWGPGRWLRIVAAVVAVVGLTGAISSSRHGRPTSGPRVDQFDAPT